MAKDHRASRKGRSSTAPFVMVLNSMMDTEAWRHLSGNDVKLLLHLMRMSKGDNGAGSEKGELFLSERLAAKSINVSRNTASGCFASLVAKGFLRPVQPGSFNVKAGERDLRATVWRLTCHPYPQRGIGPTLEFRDWKPDAPEKKQRAQKLNGTGAKIGPVPFDGHETGAKTAPVCSPRTEAAEKSGGSKIGPHLDYAIGNQEPAAHFDANGPPVADAIRAQVARYWHGLPKDARAALAQRVGLTAAELRRYVNGHDSLPVGKAMALRAQTRIAA